MEISKFDVTDKLMRFAVLWNLLLNSCEASYTTILPNGLAYWSTYDVDKLEVDPNK